MLKPSTHKIQKELANYVRTGNLTQIEGVLQHRLPHYRRLVFNVIFDTLATSYPISRKIIGREWKDLVSRFFSNHQCQNHQVWRMPFEFINYVCSHEEELIKKFKFLPDLLYFEWIEIEVYCEADVPISNYSSAGKWQNDPVLVNPHHKIIELEYPVFTKQYDDMNGLKGQYYLLVIRNLSTLKVQFLQLTPLFVMAIENLNHYQNNLFLSLKEVAFTMLNIEENKLIEKAEPTISILFEKGLFLGYKIEIK